MTDEPTTRSRPAKPIALLIAIVLSSGIAGACASSSATASASSAPGRSPTPEATAAETPTAETPTAETPTASPVPKATSGTNPSPRVTLRLTPMPAATVELPNLWVYSASVSPAAPICQTDFRLYWGISNPGGATPHDFLLQVRDVSGGVQRASFYRSVPTLGAHSPYGGMDWMNIDAGCGAQHQITITVDPTNLIAESNESDNSFTFTYTLGTVG